MRGETFIVAERQTLVTETCYSCAVLFAMPQSLKDTALAQRGGHTFYCPNGHGQCYVGESDRDKVKRLEAENTRITGEKERLANDAKLLRNEVWEKEEKLSQERSKRLTMQKRIRNGICPECNRSFTDLKRHMAAKHGDPADRKHAAQKEKKSRCAHK